MKKKAFTLIELVMVIVVLGILAALAIPRFESEVRQEAADNILSAIRYTQHLALIDDKTDPRDASWQKELWHIRFGSYTSNGNTMWFYTVSSNADKNANVDLTETAIDPSNGKRMYHLAGSTNIGITESENILIGEKYGINAVSFTGCPGNIGFNQTANASQHVAFDNIGRPHKGIYATGVRRDFRSVMHAPCTIAFSFSDTTLAPLLITIENQTGHAFINGQPNS